MTIKHKVNIFIYKVKILVQVIIKMLDGTGDILITLIIIIIILHGTITGDGTEKNESIFTNVYIKILLLNLKYL